MDLVDLNGMWPSLKDIGKGIKNAASSVGEFVSDHKQQIAAVGIAVGTVDAKEVAISAACGAVTSFIPGAGSAVSKMLVKKGVNELVSKIGTVVVESGLNGMVSAAGTVASDLICEKETSVKK